jgi:hypothetical protein
MSYANEIRARVAYAAVFLGAVLVLFGVLSDSDWSGICLLLGGLLFMMGFVMHSSLSIVNGLPWLINLISRHAIPAWNGELVHVDGGALKVRYTLDSRGNAWFVARDVCIAVGEKAPGKRELKRGDVPLLVHDGFVCFTENNVRAYLRGLAMDNHAAQRLMVNIQNNVLRQLDKQRDDKKRLG